MSDPATDPTLLGDVPPSAAAEASSATTIGSRYRVLALLGSGGMGAVYRVHDRVLDDVVALKMLRRELLGSADAIARFVQEVKLARKVTHPNVARTFDIGEHEGDRFLTMEWIDGESLAAIIARRGRLPLDEVLRIGCAICDGVGAAHQVSVVHRDLKPENVMLGSDGRVVVTDFGIARVSSSAHHTEGLIGTPAYMAPEQLKGQPVDARADVYAIGEILFELAASVRAWPGDQPFVVGLAKLSEPTPDVRRHANVPDALAAVIARCLERDVDQRYSTAGEVLASLRKIDLRAATAAPALERPTRPKVALAVRPFRSEAPEDREIGRGLAEDLLDTLSTVDGLRVRGVPSDATSDPSDDGRALGRDLGVDVVLSGTLRRVGEDARVSARLVSVADGFQIWSKRFVAPRARLLEAADDVAEAVAAALATRLVAPHRAAIDPIALEHYLRGRDLMRRHWYEPALIGQAVVALEEAIMRAPDEPTFLAASAIALSRGNPSREHDALAIARAERALEMAPHFSEAWMALATVRSNQGDFAAAIPPAAEALRRNPSLAAALSLLASVYAEVEPLDRAKELIERALALDPTATLPRTLLSRTLLLLGDQQGARRAVEGVHEGANVVLGMSLRVSLWTRTPPVLTVLPPTAYAFPPTVALFEAATTGRVSDATSAALRQFIPASVPRIGCFMHQLGAELAAACNDTEAAIASAECSVAMGLVDHAWMTRCPLFEEARRNPRWAPLEEVVAARAAVLRDALAQAHIP